MPTIVAGGGARAAHYDRNPDMQTAEYSASAVAPHAATDRWSHTVSTGKRAFIVCRASLVRVSAASVLGYASAAVRHDPSGGEAEASLVRANLLLNTVGASDGDNTTGAFANPGDVVSGESVDLSTDGTIRYEISAVLEEFDA